MIAVLVQAPMRRSNIAGLRLGKHLVRTAAEFTLVIAAEQMKNGREADYPLSRQLSELITRHLTVFRPAFNHDGLWASAKGVPMTGNAIYDAVCRRTQKEFGTAMNLHLFWDAAASFWADVAPDEIHLIRDLLGHADLRTTEQYYRHANTIRAGRTLALLLARLQSADAL
ncbi:MAG TPA: tyrosine-type recombinase/integrase [Sphingomicrobium sp.]|nr:tyrosine-type recombinase/integrase [Sphingomicrobium sp.]